MRRDEAARSPNTQDHSPRTTGNSPCDFYAGARLVAQAHAAPHLAPILHPSRTHLAPARSTASVMLVCCCLWRHGTLLDGAGPGRAADAPAKHPHAATHPPSSCTCSRDGGESHESARATRQWQGWYSLASGQGFAARALLARPPWIVPRRLVPTVQDGCKMASRVCRTRAERIRDACSVRLRKGTRRPSRPIRASPVQRSGRGSLDGRWWRCA